METKKKIKFIIPAACVILSALGVLLLFYFGFLRFNYVNLLQYPVQGLDVSHHQGRIEWNKIDTAKFKFVFIKATEGGNFADPEFPYNWVAAQKNGLVVGAYHFFTFKKSGVEQAHNFIHSVPFHAKTLPPVIDLEYMGNSRNKLTSAELHKELSDYIAIVEKHYHKKPILYSTYEFYENYLTGYFNNYPLWIRDLYHKPGLKDNRTWTFWQYTNRARVDGIKNYVDVNAFNGSNDEFVMFMHNVARQY